ncbi:MAG: CvpA family protein [Porphyromonas sp.]|nr:CvpA family protein [Porphyromonas sp.]
MNWLDCLILAVLAVAFVRGYSKGFVRSAGSLLAVLLAISFYAAFVPFLTGLLMRVSSMSQFTAMLCSKVLSLVAIVLFVGWVSRLINKLLNATPLGFLNKLGGGLLHILALVCVGSILFISYDWIDGVKKRRDEGRQSLLREGSVLYEPIKSFVPTFVPYGLFSPKSESEEILDSVSRV